MKTVASTESPLALKLDEILSRYDGDENKSEPGNLFVGWHLPSDASKNCFGDYISVPILDREDFPIAVISCNPILHNWAEKYPHIEHWADGADEGLTARERKPEEVLQIAALTRAAPEMIKALLAAQQALEPTSTEYGLVSSAIIAAQSID